jgi:hypothetical protein
MMQALVMIMPFYMSWILSSLLLINVSLVFNLIVLL